MTPTLVFDIETVPDAEGLRKVWDIDAALPDHDVIELGLARRLEEKGSDFMPLHLHRVVAIACLMHDKRGFLVKCLGTPEDGEGALIQQFFSLVDRFTPQLVSWNGGGFDLQVLVYRGLVHRVQAPRFWETGDDDREFKWNNYLSRYHTRHLDLMDQLALFTPRANAPLDELAQLCGFPGKLGMDGSQVWPAFRDGRIGEIRDYCETDVANTWLMFARYQLMRGALTPPQYDEQVASLRATLTALAEGGAEHWQQFLEAWPSAS